MKKKKLEASRKRKRSKSPAALVGVVHKDVCIGVRLIYVADFGQPGPDSVKWLKMKIPGVLLDKFQNSSSSRVYDGISMSPTKILGMLAADNTLPIPLSTITGGKPYVGLGADLSSRKRNGDNELSNSFDFCDFSDPAPQWKMGSQPLICARYRPRLVSMFGKLFAFGGNRRDSDTPFAEVFDPAVGYWQPLPNPPFEWVSDFELVVLPLFRVKRILLVATYSDFQYTFDPFTWHWHRFDTCPDLTRLVAVYNETIYWVDSLGILSMYNLCDQRYQKVYVTGICNPWFGYSNGRFFNKRVMVLYPFSEDLLGILWCKFNSLSRFPPFTHSDTNLDLVFFRLSPLDAATLSSYYLEDEELKDYFDEKTTKMTASVVDFLSVPVYHHVAHIFDAHPL